MHVNRRRGSVIPEIRVLAPSLERGLDDSYQHISSKMSYPSTNLTNSPEIYRSYEDGTDTDNRYYLANKRLPYHDGLGKLFSKN